MTAWGSPVKNVRVPTWWEHDTRVLSTPPKSARAVFSDDDRMTPREVRNLRAEISSPRQVLERCNDDVLLENLLASCGEGSVTEKLIEMVDKLLASQAAQQKIVKTLLGKRTHDMPHAQDKLDSKFACATPTKRHRISGIGAGTDVCEDNRYQVGRNALVRRSDGSWSPCHVTEIKEDGAVTVVTDTAPQAQKNIKCENVHAQLRPFRQEAVEKDENMSGSDADSQSRGSSVVRNCLDGCGMSEAESELPESEASWPMSTVTKQARARKIDKRISNLDRRQLECEVKNLRKEIDHLEAAPGRDTIR